MVKDGKKFIVVNVKKGHEGSHGGSWKVAYADFVTAMMAFFLLMWLLNMTTSDKKALLSQYFSSYSIYQSGGKSFFMTGDRSSIPSPEKSTELVHIGDDIGSGGLSPEELRGMLTEALAQELPKLKENVTIRVTKNGIRIQIADTPSTKIFQPGGAQLTEQGKKIIQTLGDLVKNLPGKIAVEGYADSAGDKQGGGSWEFSIARACAAKKELELHSTHPEKIKEVIGFGDTKPVMDGDAPDPGSRVISFNFDLSKPEKLLSPKDDLADTPRK